MATSEYRIVLTATFDTQAHRDTAYTSLKTAVTTWKGASAAGVKQVNMTKDDYVIPDLPTATEPV